MFADHKPAVVGIIHFAGKFRKLYWVSNLIELFERWAWYGFYMAFALYLVNSKDTGALELSHAQKGIIMGTGSMLLYLLPLFTGAVADRLGYRKMLFLSFGLYLSGYFMIKSFDSFGWVFFAFLWTCTGGAFFKPVISAMIARTTGPDTSSIGFGIFYMIINIGGFIGPFLAGILLQKSWDYVFYMSMAAIGINILVTLLFFREPLAGESGIPLGRTLALAFANIRETLLNWKYLLFLLIMVLFWTVFNQLYYSFPVFVDQWVDTGVLYRAVYRLFPGLALAIGTGEGTLSAVTLSSMDSFFIIAFQLLVSAFVMRYKPLPVMMGGILVLGGGISLMFSSMNGWLILLGILIFGLGEMASSPKFTEYIGRIAPEDRKALYMGTSFLPMAAGHQLAGWLSGGIFERLSDKYHLLGLELTARAVSMPAVGENFSKNDYWLEAASRLGMDPVGLNLYLWENYQPDRIVYLYAGIAATATLLLWLYDRFITGPS